MSVIAGNYLIPPRSTGGWRWTPWWPRWRVWLLPDSARLAVAAGSVAIGLGAAVILLVAIPLIRGAATG